MYGIDTSLIKPGTLIDEKFIENISESVLAEAYSTSIHGNFYPKHYSADMDENNSFQEAIEHATSTHFHIWERDHEYEEVTSKVKDCITHYLEEYELNGIKHEKITKSGSIIEIKPKRITIENEEKVHQAMINAAGEITWLQSESLQLFFQTTNPCCWNGETPQERYGKMWIPHTESRLICMLKNIKYRVRKRIIERGHYLSAQINHYSMGHTSYGTITEYNEYGEEHPWCPEK